MTEAPVQFKMASHGGLYHLTAQEEGMASGLADRAAASVVEDLGSLSVCALPSLGSAPHGATWLALGQAPITMPRGSL